MAAKPLSIGPRRMQFRRTYVFTNVLPNYKIMFIHVYMRIYLEIGRSFTYAKREP